MSANERRTFPRIKDEGLPLKLNAGDFDAATHTLDISASGLYCKIEKEIPLMSRVRLVLMMQLFQTDTGGPETSPSERLDVKFPAIAQENGPFGEEVGGFEVVIGQAQGPFLASF